jgi:hypothetical protein
VRHDRGDWISGPCISDPAGPYETSRDAAKASLWSTEGGPGSGLSIKTANLADLESATSGLALGEWDRCVMTRLAGYEPATVSVICGLIRRARQGQAERQARQGQHPRINVARETLRPT